MTPPNASTNPDAAPAVGNEMFVHNMRALWRHDPRLALLVDAVPDDQRIPLEPTRTGTWTARMTTPDGKATYLHSRHDPQAEAQRFAGAVPLEDKFCFVVSGLGLGYHVRALYERLKGDAMILCAEPSIPLIATALSCVDLADLIASERFVILADDDKTRVHERLKPYNALIMLGAEFVNHAPSMRIAPQAQAGITAVLTEFVTYTRMSLWTLMTNSRITCKNISMNLVNYVSTPPIDILRGRFVGNPAVVISAGPSLSRNIDQLGELKGRAVLCAVQTTLKPLMERGIIPDFVTSLDFHEMSRKFYDGVGNLDQVHLVAEPKATWHVIDDYPGPISLLDNSWARMVIGDELANRGGLAAGATVAHLAFYLAAYMGCDPIIFVGQDLAFTGHVFYVPGVEIHQAWRSEINRFNTMEQKEWDRIVRNRPILHRVEAATGGELYTDELLLTYLEQFEKDVAAIACKVINASEGGAKIRGTEAMPLSEAIEQHCREQIDPQRFAYRETTNWHDPARLEATQDQLQNRIDELDEVVEVCNELLELLEELKGLTDDPQRFNKRLIRVDELRAKIYQSSRAYQMVNAATQLAEFRRFSADRRIGADELEGAQRAERQISRDVEFVTGARDGAIDVKAMLTEAQQRVVEGMGKT
ncbi:MAG: motility associated factor glycosyltransferase family protein [Phycisphaerales bacterium]|nr:MAG: motility associated factor glycosyltransferase family protein [Phycisphaerales bacterium]